MPHHVVEPLPVLFPLLLLQKTLWATGQTLRNEELISLKLTRQRNPMTTPKLLIHGVPDSPAIWRPVVTALGEGAGRVHTPNLPGFARKAPEGFTATKDEYAAWLIGEIEVLHAQGGPIDIVGHDWGALLTLRAACLRPDLIRTWTVSNAVIDPDYRGHTIARLWNTPLVGEIMVALVREKPLRKALIEAGLPEDVAADEAAQWGAGHIRKNVLRLYRSANGLRFSGPWVDDLANLPAKGLVIWGENDPYVDLSVAKRFCDARGVPLQVIEGAGHWAIAERGEEVAALLAAHWAG